MQARWSLDFQQQKNGSSNDKHLPISRLQTVPPLRTLQGLASILQSLLAKLADLRAFSLVAIASLALRLRPIFTSMYIFSSCAFSAMNVRNLNSLRFPCSSRKNSILSCDWTHSIGLVPSQNLTLSLLVGSRVSSDCNLSRQTVQLNIVVIMQQQSGDAT